MDKNLRRWGVLASISTYACLCDYFCLCISTSVQCLCKLFYTATAHFTYGIVLALWDIQLTLYARDFSESKCESFQLC